MALPWTSGVFDARVEATEMVEKTFEVSAPMALSVDVGVGDVSIKVGESDEVRIYAVKHAWGRDQEQAEAYLDDFKDRLQQTATGEIDIKFEIPHKLRNISRTPSVDLEITVPRDTDLNLIVNVGKVVVTGVRGTFDVRTDVGDITLRGVRFEGDSWISGDVASIVLRLPLDSSFAFNAQCDVGDIRIDDFDVRNERADREVVSESVSGEVGASPDANVKLRTNVGDIDIRPED